ncbi:MAG TPA: hypothetical protein VG939_20490 [Caulobacteraceae bacterium]|nr:hypothetical protein [Caulobacteraceae bacterium]
MSCDAVAAAAMLWLSPMTLSGHPALQLAAVEAPAKPVAPSVAAEPLFADIVRRAAALKAEAEGFRKDDLSGPSTALPGYAAFKARIGELADLDMKGHLELKARGTDGDLKCILRGISQDLPVRLHELEAADTPKAREDALKEMTYLLRDNVEVITTPATVES